MRPYFASQSPALVLFACTLLVWAIFEVRQALRRRPGASSMDRGSLLVLRAFAAAGILVAALAAAKLPAASVSGSPLLFTVGIGLMLCGVALRLWSFRTLGRYFTFTVMTSTDQPVITSGPYRFLRHPSYFGILLLLIGIGAAYGNWLSLAALALIPPIGLIYRIRVEEKALTSSLGDAYNSYAATRKRLIPFIW
jgi:protein-S-isoprenylcysteine O-methyltransferase Ste14